jgi:hypothetical protein
MLSPILGRSAGAMRLRSAALSADAPVWTEARSGLVGLRARLRSTGGATLPLFGLIHRRTNRRAKAGAEAR